MMLIDIFPEAASIKCSGGRGGFALHLACQYVWSERVIRKLIEINPLAFQEKNDNGNYPIHCAYSTFNGIDFEQDNVIFQLLLDSDLLVMQRQNNDGDSPLHLACWYEVQSILFLDYMVRHSTSSQINLRNKKQETPLHLACLDKYDNGVEAILKHPDINPNATDNHNETPLHKVFLNHRYTLRIWGICSIVNKLLDHPFIIINHKNNKNKTPLDMIKEEIQGIKDRSYHDDDEYHDDDSNSDRNCLPEWIAAKVLLEEFPVKRRFHAYNFLLCHAMDI